jgi:hypothetical protein
MLLALGTTKLRAIRIGTGTAYHHLTIPMRAQFESAITSSASCT